MHPWLMALTIFAMPLGAAVLFFSITRLLRLLRESEVARLPAATEAEVTFNGAEQGSLAKYLVEIGSKVLQMFRILLDGR